MSGQSQILLLKIKHQKKSAIVISAPLIESIFRSPSECGQKKNLLSKINDQKNAGVRAPINKSSFHFQNNKKNENKSCDFGKPSRLILNDN